MRLPIVLFLTGLVLAVASAAANEDVDRHLESGRKGPLVVLMRHGFSDHNVLMQKVRRCQLAVSVCSRAVRALPLCQTPT